MRPRMRQDRVWRSPNHLTRIAHRNYVEIERSGSVALPPHSARPRLHCLQPGKQGGRIGFLGRVLGPQKCHAIDVGRLAGRRDRFGQKPPRQGPQPQSCQRVQPRRRPSHRVERRRTVGALEICTQRNENHPKRIRPGSSQFGKKLR